MFGRRLRPGNIAIETIMTSNRRKPLLKKCRALKRILQIPCWRLPRPRILFTLDSREPDFEKELKPILTIFTRQQLPLTLFACNETVSGKENLTAIKKALNFSRENALHMEIASHGHNHADLSAYTLLRISENISKSIRNFQNAGVHVSGFRAPSLSTEDRYRNVLRTLSNHVDTIAYDSSIAFESSLLTSMFNLIVGKKCPHRVDRIWELPISAMDDYHLLSRSFGGVQRLAFWYWALEATIWIRRRNYFLLLFHPHTIGKHLPLLEKLLVHLKTIYQLDSYTTCIQLVKELETLQNTGRLPAEVYSA